MNVLAQLTLCSSCTFHLFITSSECQCFLWLWFSERRCLLEASYRHLRNSHEEGQVMADYILSRLVFLTSLMYLGGKLCMCVFIFLEPELRNVSIMIAYYARRQIFQSIFGTGSLELFCISLLSVRKNPLCDLKAAVLCLNVTQFHATLHLLSFYLRLIMHS